jgi:hypothetical protein
MIRSLAEGIVGANLPPRTYESVSEKAHLSSGLFSFLKPVIVIVGKREMIATASEPEGQYEGRPILIFPARRREETER